MNGGSDNKKSQKAYNLRSLNSPVQLLTTENITYTPRTELQSIRGEIYQFKTKVSSFRTYDQDILEMPAFTFENKPINWGSFTKDLSILVPGFPPKNRYLLKQFIQKSEQSDLRLQEESHDSNQRSNKKKKYTDEELKEKKRREKPYSYEYYVEGRHIIRDAKMLRIQQLASTMIKRSRIHYYQQLKKRELIDDIVDQTDFIHHTNFMPDTSLPLDAESKDPFDIFNVEGLEDEVSKKGGIKSTGTNFESEKAQERIAERAYHHHHSARNELRLSKNTKEKNLQRQVVEKPEKETTNVFAEPNISKNVRRKSDSSLWSGGISKLEVKTQNICVNALPVSRGRKEKQLPQKLLRIDLQHPVHENANLIESTPINKKNDKDKNPSKRRNSFITKHESMLLSNLHRKVPSIHQNMPETITMPPDRKSYIKTEAESGNQLVFADLSLDNSGSSNFTHKSIRASYIDKDFEKRPLLYHSNSNPQDLKMLRDFIKEEVSSPSRILKNQAQNDTPRLLLNNQTIKESESPLELYGNSPTNLLRNLSSPPNLSEKVSPRRTLFLNTHQVKSEIQELDSYTSSPSGHKISQNESLSSGSPDRDPSQSGANSRNNFDLSKRRMNSFGDILKMSDGGMHLQEINSEYDLGKNYKYLSKKNSLPVILKPNKAAHPKGFSKTKLVFIRTEVKLPDKKENLSQKISAINAAPLKMVSKPKKTTHQKSKEQNILSIYSPRQSIYSPRQSKEKEAKEIKTEVVNENEYQIKKESPKKANLEKKSMKTSSQWTSSPLAYVHKFNHPSKKSSKY